MNSQQIYAESYLRDFTCSSERLTLNPLIARIVFRIILSIVWNCKFWFVYGCIVLVHLFETCMKEILSSIWAAPSQLVDCFDFGILLNTVWLWKSHRWIAAEFLANLFQYTLEGVFVINLWGFFLTRCLCGLCKFSSISNGKILGRKNPSHAW